eukprot:Partr_v1_DN27545_c0_g1_i1_m30891
MLGLIVVLALCAPLASAWSYTFASEWTPVFKQGGSDFYGPENIRVFGRYLAVSNPYGYGILRDEANGQSVNVPNFHYSDFYQKSPADPVYFVSTSFGGNLTIFRLSPGNTVSSATLVFTRLFAGTITAIDYDYALLFVAGGNSRILIDMKNPEIPVVISEKTEQLTTLPDSSYIYMAGADIKNGMACWVPIQKSSFFCIDVDTFDGTARRIDLNRAYFWRIKIYDDMVIVSQHWADQYGSPKLDAKGFIYNAQATAKIGSIGCRTTCINTYVKSMRGWVRFGNYLLLSSDGPYLSMADISNVTSPVTFDDPINYQENATVTGQHEIAYNGTYIFVARNTGSQQGQTIKYLRPSDFSFLPSNYATTYGSTYAAVSNPLSVVGSLSMSISLPAVLNSATILVQNKNSDFDMAMVTYTASNVNNVALKIGGVNTLTWTNAQMLAGAITVHSSLLSTASGTGSFVLNACNGRGSCLGPYTITVTITGVALSSSRAARSSSLSRLEISSSQVARIETSSHIAPESTNDPYFSIILIPQSSASSAKSNAVVAKGESQTNGSLLSNPRTILIFGLAAMVVLLIVIMASALYCKRQHRYESATKFTLRPRRSDIPDAMSEIKGTNYDSVLMTDSSATQHTRTNLSDNLRIQIPAYKKLNKASIIVGSKLAEGGNGEIFEGELRAVSKSTNSKQAKIVVKCVKVQGETEEITAKNHADFLQEVAITDYMSKNPHCVRLIGFVPDECMIVLKRYPTSLSKWLSSIEAEKFTLPAVRTIATDLCKALVYVHQEGFAHNDVKPLNVLLDFDNNHVYRAILTDFGLASATSDKTQDATVSATAISSSYRRVTPAGLSVQYAAPEVISRSQMPAMPIPGDESQAGDVYAYGMSLIHIVTRRPPWTNQPVPEIIERVMSGDRPDYTTPIVNMGSEWAQFLEIIDQAVKQKYFERTTMAKIVGLLTTPSSMNSQRTSAAGSTKGAESTANSNQSNTR